VLAGLGLLLAGCGLAGLGQPAIDEAVPGMPEPIGPIVEVGDGDANGVGWRYSVYESRDGTCTRLEFDDGIRGESCGPGLGLLAGDRSMGVSGVGTGTGQATHVDGFASDEVAAVWLETDAGRVRATLMPLAAAGLEGQAFLAVVPPGQRVGDAVALDAVGEELGREPVDVP
jgi:hypothetical protein